MKEKIKLSTEIEKEKLFIQTFKNIIEGSRSINGVTWNRIKNLKRKDQILCLKQLSQQKQLYGFFLMLLIKNCKICNTKFKDITSNHNKVYCSKKCARKNQTIRVSKLKEVNIKRVCKGCNKKFIQKFTRTKLYCNQNCYEKTYTEWKKEFYKNKYHTDKEFRKKTLKRSNQYHKKNPHIVKKIWLNRKKRMESDPKYLKKRRDWEKKYVLLNKEKIAERVKQWRLRTLQIRKQKAKEYALKNRDKILKYLKEWHKRPEVRTKRIERFKERRKTDPFFRMKLSLKGRLNSFVYRGRAKKIVSNNELIGCDWSYFKKYIQKQFRPG